MANFDEHIDQAEHNEEMADILLNPACTSAAWVTIMAFYAALQYFEAAFTKNSVQHLEQYYSSLPRNQGRKPSKHAVMEDILVKNPDFTNLYNYYRDLRIGSEYCRYLKPGYQWFLDEKRARICYEENLQKIKSGLQAKNYI